MKSNSFLIIAMFVIVSIADLFMVVKGLPRFYTKPLIMICLMAYYYKEAKDKHNFNLMFFVALVFAFLGDSLLMFEGFFLLGLVSFLVMQLLYAFIFFRERGDIHWYKVLFVIILLAVGFYLAKSIIPVAAEYKIPVIAYSACISMMGAAGALRKDLSGYWLVLIGVVSFVFSDSLLGVNMFVGPVQYGDFGVTLSYILAQYLIVSGFLKSSD